MQKDSYTEIFKDKERILVVLAHPDDTEVNCGGLTARLTQDSKKVRFVITTNGGKGSRDRKDQDETEFAKINIQEQLVAGTILGVPEEENINLGIPDGEVNDSLDHIEKIVFHIREFRPDIVITHNPSDTFIKFSDTSWWVNHRDHINTAKCTVNAMYPYARDWGFFPRHFEMGLTPWTVKELLYADAYQDPTLRYFDISSVLDIRKKALAVHKTAFNEEDVADYMSEVEINGGHFEQLGYVKIY